MLEKVNENDSMHYTYLIGVGDALTDIFLILITCLLDIVLMKWGEILSWSLKGVKDRYHWAQVKTMLCRPHNQIIRIDVAENKSECNSDLL